MTFEPATGYQLQGGVPSNVTLFWYKRNEKLFLSGLPYSVEDKERLGEKKVVKYVRFEAMEEACVFA